jgi:hypothetical protein
MTLDEHNRLLGILHLIYGGLHAAILVVVALFMGLALVPLSLMPRGDAPPVFFFVAIFAFGLMLSALFLLPPFLAGYGLLKRKSWGRTAGIVAAVLMALNIPIGTALAVYSFWFLLGEGARLHDPGRLPGAGGYTLGDAPPHPEAEWFNAARERERGYAPGAKPPDWRGE